MKRLLLFLLLLPVLQVAAQSNWPEAFAISADSASYKRMDAAYWQYLEMGNDSITLKAVLMPKFQKRFKNLDEKTRPAFTEKQNVWVRYKLHNPHTYPLSILLQAKENDISFFIGPQRQRFNHGYMVPWKNRSGLKSFMEVVYTVPANTEVEVYVYLKSIGYVDSLYPKPGNYNRFVEQAFHNTTVYTFNDAIAAAFFGFIFFAVIFNMLFYYVNRERVYLLYSLTLVFAALYAAIDIISMEFLKNYPAIAERVQAFLILTLIFLMIHTARFFFNVRQYYPRWDRLLVWSPIIIVGLGILSLIFQKTTGNVPVVYVSLAAIVILITLIGGTLIILISFLRKKNAEARLFVIAALPFLVSLILSVFTDIEWIVYGGGLWTIVVLSWGMFERFRRLQSENARIALEKEEERSRMIAQQNELLETQVAERTAALENSILELKKTQNQLIQSEKMASLGELTAGIAHEIQNPLNFVNNFSDVSAELLEELKEEVQKGDLEEVNAIADDVIQNLQKIAHHGRRADGIVKGMLQHSRTSTGQKEATDVNALADEYLRLAYHGLRAKDKSFNADLVTNFAEGLSKINIISQDVGRVLLNLFTNAFYATQEKGKQSQSSGYKPVVTVSTKQVGTTIEIMVKDNGTGIPDSIKDKILQPFFTTKPTGEGTGLGLSLSYDIIVKGHAGSINIESTEGEGSAFIITLPL